MTLLSEAETGHLKYLLELAEQPGWESFYRTPAEGMNFGLRFQLAFSAYALFGLARRTPAYPALYANAIQKLIEKMLRPDVWAYWFQGAVLRSSEPENSKSPKAIEFVHSRLGLASGVLPPDPCQEGNVQYSGHLASMLGFYELLGGDTRYDTPGFVLQAEAGGQLYEFPYTHTSLATRIYEQMSQNYFHGVCCEPGRAYAACNNHACISNVLHDRLHGTNFAETNANWAKWVQDKMLTGRGALPLPAPNGLLSVAYMPDLHLPIPISFNLTDAWGLAFMALWQPEIVHELYPRFRKRLKAQGAGLKLNSRGPNENFEISTEGLNTGFALLLAREMGDSETASRLLYFAEQFLEPIRDEYGFYYAARPAPYLTALFALAAALPETGGGLSSLLDWRPDFSALHLTRVTGQNISIRQAENTSNGLEISLQGEPGTPVELHFAQIPAAPRIMLNQTEFTGPTLYDETTQKLKLKLAMPGKETQVVVSRP